MSSFLRILRVRYDLMPTTVSAKRAFRKSHVYDQGSALAEHRYAKKSPVAAAAALRFVLDHHLRVRGRTDAIPLSAYSISDGHFAELSIIVVQRVQCDR